MVIRKGKLYRPCRKCHKMFEPIGKAHYICDACNKNNTKFLHLLALKQQRLDSIEDEVIRKKFKTKTKMKGGTKIENEY